MVRMKDKLCSRQGRRGVIGATRYAGWQGVFLPEAYINSRSWRRVIGKLHRLLIRVEGQYREWMGKCNSGR